MYPHHSLGVGVGGVGVGIGAGVGVGGGVGVGQGLGVGVGGWMLVRRSYKRKTNITTPKYLPDAEYDILNRVCIECTWTGGQCESSGRQTKPNGRGGVLDLQVGMYLFCALWDECT